MRLSEIQQKLKAPKNQRNSFGGYNYRSCEDILEAVKPLLGGAVLTISDEIVHIGDRFYVKATARFRQDDGAEGTECTAYARESLDKKGMDAAQITGAASSYARKYALNGLFLIDDTKDADTDEHTAATKEPKEPMKPYTVPRTVPPADDEAGGAVIKDDPPSEADQKVRIATLVDELRGKPTVRTIAAKKKYYGDQVFDLTGLSLELENYDTIIKALEAEKQSRDA